MTTSGWICHFFFGFEVMRCNFVIFYGVEYGIDMYCVHFLITTKF
ncbi:hypothetical protein LTSESEN_0510 [Salmonella enterica subsp. enterica serovar Senftenberg str. A4-543]|uniref:Uncharacterized protein n=1 Tax=Salmonella enterica subsp. enterica serovar Senftenberg str. A4-543 TaxID=913082 RepID=G5QV58_SALSE|nr:hypothetical protein LTSESEN_0510 [Salmonella enterica subsp. enterica serovar Senftenberg str. A4-543]